MMPGVERRVALVTGAGRGIGRVAADLLASRGARVMAVARSENEVQALGLDYVVADLGTAEAVHLRCRKHRIVWARLKSWFAITALVRPMNG